MSEKTTQSNDSSNELKIENLDPASQAAYARMKGYNFSLYAVGFQPEVDMDKELTTEDIMEGVATNKDSAIKIVKHGKTEFSRFILHILNGLMISLKVNNKNKETSKAKGQGAKPKDRGSEK